MQRRKLTRRQQRRRMRKIVQETVAAILLGLGMGALVIVGFAFDDYEPPEAPEHFGQIEYCGQWWDPEDYEQMMAEREAYIESERAEEEAFYQQVLAAGQRQEQAAIETYQSIIASKDWDAEESYMLAKIAMAEAEGEDTEGKALVILTVLNRVWSDGFPDSIAGVITEEGQFTAYENGRYDRVEPDEDCYRALDMVMIEHWDESYGATYFESDGESTWHEDNLVELFKHGNHTFYKEADSQ